MYSQRSDIELVPAANDGIAGHGGCTMYQLFVGLVTSILNANHFYY
jgi:hypothetical protein